MEEDAASPDRRSWRTIAGGAALLVCFWATALAADWFLDNPFWYEGRTPWVQNLAVSGTRWLPRSEALLVAAVVVFLIPAIIVGAIGLARRTRIDPLEWWFKRADAERTVVVLSVAIAVLASAVVAFLFVRGAELIDDERAYLFSARLFAHGHVGLPTPPHALVNPMILLEPMWTSRYPPGQSLILAPATLVGAEHLVEPILAGVLVLAAWSFARDSFGPRHGALAALLAATSPFVWAMHGTVMAFGTTATCLAVFLAAIARAERTERTRWLALAGFAVGYAFITRPFDAIAFAAPFALRTLWEARSKEGRARLLWSIAGFAAIAWVLPAHNQLVMGHWWEMTYSAPGVVPFHVGFGKLWPWSELEHTPAQAIGNLVGVLSRLEVAALGPIGLVLAGAGALRGAPSRADVLLRATLVSYLVFFLIVPFGGTWDVGPTYYYPLMPVLVPLAVRGVASLRAHARLVVGWATLVGVVITVTSVFPMRAAHLSELSWEITAPWDMIERSNIGPAIVIVPAIDQRRAPGWAHGHPYTLTTDHGDRVDLISVASERELADAIAYLGNKPVYLLVLDRDYYQATGHRRFTLQPVKPPG
jgi:hypothetical protein